MALKILVFAERRDGELKRPSLEAISTARRLADGVGGSVEVVAVGTGAAGHADLVASHGADRLHVVEADFLDLYSPEGYVAAIADVARATDAAVILCAATIMGKDVAARVTARLDGACANDLVEVDVDAEGVLRGRRPVFSGQAIARVAIPSARPAVATLRPNAFPATVLEGRSAEVVNVDSSVGAETLRARTVRVEQPEQQELDVAEASIVVSGGRGLKEPEHFSLVRDLAESLGGAVGASRAVVDAGWIGHAHQVGQTGKVVSPDLYVALGISGAVQHLAGMSSSKVIVAVNKDPEAPIFKIADYGIVGDVFEIAPALTAAIKAVRGG